jgi:hypothetical protein
MLAAVFAKSIFRRKRIKWSSFAGSMRIASTYIIYNIVYPAGTDKRCPAERCGALWQRRFVGSDKTAVKERAEKQITEQKSVKSNK